MEEQLTSYKTLNLIPQKVLQSGIFKGVITQSLLQQWFRDTHKIQIEVQSRLGSWVFFIYDLNNWNRECLLNIDWYQSNEDFKKIGIPSILKSYEEALEIALQRLKTKITPLDFSNLNKSDDNNDKSHDTNDKSHNMNIIFHLLLIFIIFISSIYLIV